MRKATSVKLKPETLEKLDNLAKKTARTKSFYIQLALEEYLEDIELASVAESRLEDYRRGKTSVVSWEEVKKENGL